MSNENAANAHASQHVSTMGPELGPLFYTLSQQAFRLRTLHDEHRAMFGESQDQFDILNRAAGTFFYLVDYALWESILMFISRLTGPAETRLGKRVRKNVSLRRIPDLVSVDLRDETALVVKEATRAAEFCQDARKVSCPLGPRPDA